MKWLNNAADDPLHDHELRIILTGEKLASPLGVGCFHGQNDRIPEFGILPLPSGERMTQSKRVQT